MAKRYTDTDKWKKTFIRGLSPEYKLFWLYLLDECDHSGIWHVEFEIIESRLGVKISPEKARGFLKDKIVVFDSATKWFIPDFIEFQYGELKEENRAHKSVIDRLEKYKLFKKNKGLTRVLQDPMDKDKEMDKEGGVGEKEIPDNPEQQSFAKFSAWIKENAPRVAKMKEPFTIEQFIAAKEKHQVSEITDILVKMNNWKPLLEKNISSYLTFCNWVKKEFNQPESNKQQAVAPTTVPIADPKAIADKYKK